MNTPPFESEKDARAWIVGDAVQRAIEPYYAVLSEAGIADLRRVLEDAAETHPVLRPFGTRAAKALLPISEEQPALKAAKRPSKKDLERSVPKARPPKVPDPALTGMADLRKPEFSDAAIGVIKSLATYICDQSRVPVKGPFRDDLVQEGWLAAIKVCETWDGTKSSFTTYLWRCARAHMINVAWKGSNWRDTPAGCFLDELDDPAKERKTADPIKRFHEAMSTSAASFVVGWAKTATPEEVLIRFRDHQAVKDAVRALDERSRDLLQLVYDAGMKVAPAGESLGMPESTARWVHKTALDTITAELQKASNVRAFPRRAAAS